MKWIPKLALFTLVTLMAIPGAVAQGVVLKANIPFAFTVGETVMPSGEYMVSTPGSGIIWIENTDKHLAAAVTSMHGYHDAGWSSKLEFDRYGTQYFLHRIYCPVTTSMNVDIPAWKPEKRARAREAKLDRGEKVFVAAK